MRGMSQENMDLGVFQETKVTKGIYTWKSSGYKVEATEAPSVHSGGVTIFYRVAEHFSMEELQIYRANVVRFQLASAIGGGLSWSGTWHQTKPLQ